MYSIKEASTLLGISKKTIQRFINQGHLKVCPRGADTVITDGGYSRVH